MAHKGIPLGTRPAGCSTRQGPPGADGWKTRMAKMALPKFAMNKTVLAGVAGAAILVIGGAAVMAGGGKGGKPGEYHYETVTVERGTVSRVVSASGAVQPKERVDVGSEVSGKIV